MGNLRYDAGSCFVNFIREGLIGCYGFLTSKAQCIPQIGNGWINA